MSEHNLIKEKSPDEIADDIFDVVFKDNTNAQKQLILCERIAHAIRSEREKAEGNLKCVTDYSKHLKEQIAELQRQVEEAKQELAYETKRFALNVATIEFAKRELVEGLKKAEEIISSEYCMHDGPCIESCCANFIHRLLNKYGDPNE